MYDGGMMGWGWSWLIGVVLFVLLIALVGGLAAGLVRHERHDDALEALRLRYARGEIDRAEYDERRQALTARR